MKIILLLFGLLLISGCFLGEPLADDVFCQEKGFERGSTNRGWIGWECGSSAYVMCLDKLEYEHFDDGGFVTTDEYRCYATDEAKEVREGVYG